MSKLFVMYIGMQQTATGRPIDATEQDANLHFIKSELADRFGGYSAGWVDGGYRAKNGELAEERAVRAEVTGSEEMAVAVVEVVQLFKRAFEQESVLLNVTNIESSFI